MSRRWRSPRTTIRTWRSRKLARVAGNCTAPVSRSVSPRTWATVFSANSASASSTRWRCSSSWRSSSTAPSTRPRRTGLAADADRAARDRSAARRRAAARRGRPPRRRSAAPRRGRASAARRSDSGRSRTAAALSTARTPVAISSSAAIRSMLRWSMTATSPGRQPLDQVLGAAAEPGDALDRLLRGRAVPP